MLNFVIFLVSSTTDVPSYILFAVFAVVLAAFVIGLLCVRSKLNKRPNPNQISNTPPTKVANEFYYTDSGDGNNIDDSAFYDDDYATKGDKEMYEENS